MSTAKPSFSAFRLSPVLRRKLLKLRRACRCSSDSETLRFMIVYCSDHVSAEFTAWARACLQAVIK